MSNLNIVPPPATGELPDVAMHPSISNYQGLKDKAVPGLVEKPENIVEPPETEDFPEVAIIPSISNYHGLRKQVIATPREDKEVTLQLDSANEEDYTVMASFTEGNVGTKLEDDIVITGFLVDRGDPLVKRAYTVTIPSGDYTGNSSVIFTASENIEFDVLGDIPVATPDSSAAIGEDLIFDIVIELFSTY